MAWPGLTHHSMSEPRVTSRAGPGHGLPQRAGLAAQHVRAGRAVGVNAQPSWRSWRCRSVPQRMAARMRRLTRARIGHSQPHKAGVGRSQPDSRPPRRLADSWLRNRAAALLAGLAPSSTVGAAAYERKPRSMGLDGFEVRAERSRPHPVSTMADRALYDLGPHVSWSLAGSNPPAFRFRRRRVGGV